MMLASLLSCALAWTSRLHRPLQGSAEDMQPEIDDARLTAQSLEPAASVPLQRERGRSASSPKDRSAYRPLHGTGGEIREAIQ